MTDKARRFPRALALAAVAIGIAGGTYGVASAASGSGGNSGSSSGSAATSPSATTPPAAAPWGHQRSDETVLTGDTASKVRELALAKVPGGTIVRVETDADGHAAYEAHMIDADGNPVTVYVDASFNVVSVETGGPGGRGGAPPAAGSATAPPEAGSTT
jgi:Peptidase propeptide and YPEB domain